MHGGIIARHACEIVWSPIKTNGNGNSVNRKTCCEVFQEYLVIMNIKLIFNKFLHLVNILRCDS